MWVNLGVSDDEREKVDEEVDDTEKADQEVKTKDLFAIFAPDAWKRTVLGLFLMGIQQASGIDGVLYVRVLRESSFSSPFISGSTYIRGEH